MKFMREIAYDGVQMVDNDNVSFGKFLHACEELTRLKFRQMFTRIDNVSRQ
ncbi:hypothetical protein HanHA300_Chr01g0010391 [Helianthus annuus]|nr:hypothetical protein HanHA300_Chr01g0010391 [Helianthus annuus]KAJ0621916.1 hypothetical protein HanIR_Chr01g0014181 [Helianthus annuus]KAJ0626280.1 hypothetical protein HanHA89_Chr01g0011361 [Helianthus annuus]KAJ0807773.1 hypothetical protein HanLR1_Chr00c1098g0790381 [Helianthus annuus]